VADLPSTWMPPSRQSTELQSKNYIFLQQTLRTGLDASEKNPSQRAPKCIGPPDRRRRPG